MEVLQRVLADVLPGAVSDHQQFGGRNDPAIHSGDQRLCHHCCQCHGHLLPDGVLPLGRERVGHLRHRRPHIGRMHARKNQVAGLAGRQSDPHGFRVAHFADNDESGA
jgi:hypothetical protein